MDEEHPGFLLLCELVGALYLQVALDIGDSIDVQTRSGRDLDGDSFWNEEFSVDGDLGTFLKDSILRNGNELVLAERSDGVDGSGE